MTYRAANGLDVDTFDLSITFDDTGLFILDAEMKYVPLGYGGYVSSDDYRFLLSLYKSSLNQSEQWRFVAALDKAEGAA
jgi:hypothetical protein